MTTNLAKTDNGIVRIEGIEAQIVALPPLKELEALWCTLEERAKASFFLSWRWIGAWLLESGATPALFVAQRNRSVVGLALIGADCSRLGPLRVPRIYLNQSGSPDFDCVYIEYNDVLVDFEYENAAREAYLAAVCHREIPGRLQWSEMHWVASPLAAEQMPANPKLVMDRGKTSVSPFIHLDAVRKSGNDLCALLSSNTRSQIRRSVRLYHALGELHLDRASTRRDALNWLEELRCLHQARWISQGAKGAFAQPFFARFLRRLVEREFDSGVVDILRVSAGAYDFAYLCNFVYRDRVSSYQAGFRFGPDGRYKPGLVAHALAAQHYSRHNSHLRLYSLLAGGAQYKRSLSTGAEELFWFVYRPTSRLIGVKKAVAFLVDHFASRMEASRASAIW